MESEEAELLSSFLLPMLHYYPDSRATAAELVKHPWLDGVVVQGDIEMMEREHRERIAAASDAAGENGVGAKAVDRDRTPVGIDEVARLGPPVKGMVGMGRI